jgi:NTE family protein
MPTPHDEYYQTEIFNKADNRIKLLLALLSATSNLKKTPELQQYPTEGVFNSVSVKYITGKETNTPGTTSNVSYKSSAYHNFFLLKAHSSKYFKLNRRFTLGTQAEAVFSNRDFLKNYRSTLLAAPGFYPTPTVNHSLSKTFIPTNTWLAG